jgi:hypothetical protein
MKPIPALPKGRSSANIEATLLENTFIEIKTLII